MSWSADPYAARYDVNQYGEITTPGKFEGEHLHACYYYDAWMDGGADLEIEQGALFVVNESERRDYPILKDAYGVAIGTDDQGFVWSLMVTEDEYCEIADADGRFN